MNKKTFVCANCAAKLPFRRAILLSNFSKIKCSSCGAINIPDKSINQAIGAGGGVSLFIACEIALNLYGIGAAILTFFVGLGLAVAFVYKMQIFHIE